MSEKSYRHLLVSLAVIACLSAVLARHEISKWTGVGKPRVALTVIKPSLPADTVFEVKLSSGDVAVERQPEGGWKVLLGIVMLDASGKKSGWVPSKVTELSERHWSFRAVDMTKQPDTYFSEDQPTFAEELRRTTPRSYRARVRLGDPEPFARGATAAILESSEVRVEVQRSL